MENNSQKILHDLKVLLFDEMDTQIGSLELPDTWANNLEKLLQTLVDIYFEAEFGIKRIETYSSSSDTRNVDEVRIGKPYAIEVYKKKEEA